MVLPNYVWFCLCGITYHKILGLSLCMSSSTPAPSGTHRSSNVTEAGSSGNEKGAVALHGIVRVYTCRAPRLCVPSFSFSLVFLGDETNVTGNSTVGSGSMGQGLVWAIERQLCASTTLHIISDIWRRRCPEHCHSATAIHSCSSIREPCTYTQLVAVVSFRVDRRAKAMR
jgi:hypothetical protein